MIKYTLYLLGTTILLLRVFLLFFAVFFSCLSLEAQAVNFSTDNDPTKSRFEDLQLQSLKLENEDGPSLQYDKANQELIYQRNGESKRFSAWISIVPPLIAILMALLFKEVHVALILGIFFGVFSLNGFQLSQLFSSFLQIADTYIIQAIAWSDSGEIQTGHLSIILFSLLIGGMVHIISSNGGMNGVVSKVSKLATSARRTQLATMLMGCLIFFDDYANSLVVGNTMRPLTDKFKISREKLAYIVDSTAAPIASVAFVTTWIGYQLSEIEKGLALQNFVVIEEGAYSIFLGSLKYAYYPVFTLFFMSLLILFKRDFGPMRKAEIMAREAKKTKTMNAQKQKISHWINAALPVLTLIVMVMVGLILTGYSTDVWNSSETLMFKLRSTLSNADSYIALIWASFLACTVAVVVSKLSNSLGVKESIESLIEGVKSMVPAIAILVLAWALAGVIENLHTASFLASLVPESFNPYWLPGVFFVLSALISFATGSSWNTMAVMYPICIPIVIGVSVGNGSDVDLNYLMPVLLNTISVILAASVFGDHCSPISDTTILSSLATDCNHIDHVKTQMPYAFIVGLVSLFCGGVLFAAGIPWYILYTIGFACIIGLVFLLGTKEKNYEN